MATMTILGQHINVDCSDGVSEHGVPYAERDLTITQDGELGRIRVLYAGINRQRLVLGKVRDTSAYLARRNYESTSEIPAIVRGGHN